MKRIECLLTSFAVLILCGSTLRAQPKREIILQVTDIPSQTGRILATVGHGEYYGWADAADFPVEIKLENVSNGTYEIYVFHDANGNWELDKENGVPTERCATRKIEVTDSVRTFSVALVDIKDRIKTQHKRQEQQLRP